MSIDFAPTNSPAIRFLNQGGIPYRLFFHPEIPEDIEDAARQRGQKIDQIIRSILFHISRKGYFMTLIAGPGQISWRRLRKYLGESRISLAVESEVLRVTGYVIGTVNPLGLPSPVRILADTSIFRPDEISMGSGIQGIALIMHTEHLKKAMGPIEIGIFSEFSPTERS